MILCCKCNKKYEFKPYGCGLRLPVIVCPHCGYRHTVKFAPTDDDSRLTTSPVELKLTSAAPILYASRILNASRVAQAADNTGVAGWTKTNEFIVVFQLDEEKGPWTAAYKLQWRNDTDSPTGTYNDLASTGEIKWGSATDLANGNAVVIGEKACTATGASGSTWQDGWEVEGASTSSSLALKDEYYTEIQFACNSSDAHNGDAYSFQIYDATNSAVVGTASAKLKTVQTAPSIALNTADLYDFGSDTTPTLEFTGTDAQGEDCRYNIQIHTDNTFGLSVMDSYGTENADSTKALYYGSSTALSQSFTGDGNTVTGCQFYLRKVGAPTGVITAKLYTHSGTYGTDSVPTGSPLTTSDPVDATSLTGSAVLYDFIFPTPYTTVNGTKYCIVVEYSDSFSNSYNEVDGWRDSSSSTASGNYAEYITAWTAYPADLIFYVKKGSPLLNKISGTDAGFVNTVDGGDTDPFTSGQKISYTVQAGDALSSGTYYWRARVKDPAGTNAYSAWSATRSFTVTPPSSVVSSINGVPIANLSKWNGVPIASIARINGINI